MKHYINEYYRYSDSKTKFKLIRVNNYIYYFDKNHWCTDNVFIDLIRCKTNVQNYQNNQLELLL